MTADFFVFLGAFCLDSSGRALLWHVAREFDLFLVLRENERNIKLNSGKGLGVRSLCLKLEDLPGSRVGVVSKNVRPRLLELCSRGLVFVERGSDGVSSQEVFLYRLPPEVVVFLGACGVFLGACAGGLK